MRDPEAGLTLVEMLVALALFALVGVASLAMLDGVLRTRDGTEGRLEAVASIDRALIRFGRDFGQAAPGTISLEESALHMVRPGQSITWETEDDALRRRLEPVDDAPEGDDLSQLLLSEVAAVSFRVLDGTGTWQETWPAMSRTRRAQVGVQR